MTAGYSGKPLPAKLGIAEGDLVALVGDVPADTAALLTPLPQGSQLRAGHRGKADVVLFFTTRRRLLEQRIEPLGQRIFPDGMLWVAWPKRASGVETDVTEDAVRDVALARGLVDTKVCAIDETWSGLRLVWRKERRASP